MNFSLNAFRAKLSAEGGLNRAAFFGVRFTFPANVTSTPTFLNIFAGSQTYPMLCKGARLPANEVEPIILSYFSRKVKIPGARQYQPLNLSFFTTGNFAQRHAFDEWQALFSSHTGNARGVRESLVNTNPPTAPPPTFDAMTAYATIEVTAYGMGTVLPLVVTNPISGVGVIARNTSNDPYPENVPLNTYIFENAFPTRIGGLEFSYDNTDLQTYDVDFEYLNMRQAIRWSTSSSLLTPP